jgi:hypothetical protein
MKLTKEKCLGARGWMGYCWMALVLIAMVLGSMAYGQGVSTTTVQGTVYLANGRPGAGTLDVSWPGFTTANNLAVASGRLTVAIAPDGFISVNLTPNVGATPAGLYYTAVYHMSDGTTSTEYWVVPAGAQAALGQVRAQVMPAAQAVQAVNRAYVDQSIAQTASTLVSASGGTMSGPLILSGDPTQALQAADKHYVDANFAKALPLAGGAATGPLTAIQLGAAYQVDQFQGLDFAKRGERRNVRCAELYRHSVDGIERDDLDCEFDRAAAMHDDFDGEAACGDGGNAERGVARMRAARNERGKWEPGRDGVSVLGTGRDGAGGRSGLHDRYAGIPPG